MIDDRKVIITKVGILRIIRTH